MIEVTNNVFSTGRVRPNFFGQSRARMMSRGLMGLGGVEDYKEDSVAILQSKIAGFKLQLANAQKERAKCESGTVGNVALTLLTFGLAAPVLALDVECRLRWDGQIGWFNDRISEATAAMGQAQQRARAAAAAEAQALAAGLDADGKTGSKGKALTGTGIPTWAKVLGGAVLLGGAAYAITRVVRK